MLDIASELSMSRLERAIERSEELRLFDLSTVESLLARAAGHPGLGRLRRALDIYRDDLPFTRSGLERRFRELVAGTELPEPVMNYDFGGYELDAFWPRERFAVELDVYETHGTRAAFERDRLRQEELKLQGVEMIRVTGPRLDREPSTVLERLAALLRQRRLQLGLDRDAGRATASSRPAGG